eukprot:12155842-Alexandrium_andersonii.AAC.1
MEEPAARPEHASTPPKSRPQRGQRAPPNPRRAPPGARPAKPDPRDGEGGHLSAVARPGQAYDAQ